MRRELTLNIGLWLTLDGSIGSDSTTGQLRWAKDGERRCGCLSRKEEEEADDDEEDDADGEEGEEKSRLNLRKGDLRFFSVDDDAAAVAAAAAVPLLPAVAKLLP